MHAGHEHLRVRVPPPVHGVAVNAVPDFPRLPRVELIPQMQPHTFPGVTEASPERVMIRIRHKRRERPVRDAVILEIDFARGVL
jgi:hypothetical protein